ncbi:protein phosphatase 2C [Naegleria gruberi]|uniref:protein-serine/threonine phosphatase n=1 Tax=Naegleria gruberi TaxID=5762 RepID=D2V4P0_NAEGR|nr:protein phosphatase 2C [Naegleria gruberi]EFC48137.1 protein phosphatase 2C [Naegleria gruberi]|eukprot:XP_002680881.1 protein phosphatase 2C [Naegleria gruberi strain NEG-M]
MSNNNNNNTSSNNNSEFKMPPPPNMNNITSSLKSGTASIILNKGNNQGSVSPSSSSSNSTAPPIQLGQGIGSNQSSEGLVKTIMHKMPIFHSRTKSFGGTATTSMGTISTPNNRGSLKMDQPVSLTISSASPTTTSSSQSPFPNTNSGSNQVNSSLPPSTSGNNITQFAIVKSTSTPLIPTSSSGTLPNSTSTPNISTIDASPLVPPSNSQQHNQSKHLAFTFTNFSNVPSVLTNHLCMAHQEKKAKDEQRISRSTSENSNLSTITSESNGGSESDSSIPSISPSMSLHNISSTSSSSGFLEYKSKAVCFPCYEGSPLQQIGYLPSALQIQNGTPLSHSTSNPTLSHSNSGSNINTLASSTSIPSGLSRSKSRDSGIASSLAEANKNNTFWKNTSNDPHYIYKYNVSEVMTYISNNSSSGMTNPSNANSLLYHDIVLYYRDKSKNTEKSTDSKTKQPGTPSKTSSFPNSVFIKDLSMNGLTFHGTRINTRHQKYDPVNVLTHLNYYLQLYNSKVQKNFSLFYNVYRLHYDPKTGAVSNPSIVTPSPDVEEVTLIAYPFVEYPYLDPTDEKHGEKMACLPPRHTSNFVAESLFHFIFLESKGTFVFEANEMFCYGSYLFGKFDCRIFDNGGGASAKKSIKSPTELTEPSSPQSKKSNDSNNFSEYTEVKRFFSKHQCNDLCKDLNLLKHPSQMDYYRQAEQSIFKFLNHHVTSVQQSQSDSESNASTSVIPFIWRDPLQVTPKKKTHGISPNTMPPPGSTPGNNNNTTANPTESPSQSIFDFEKKQLPLAISCAQERGKRNYMEDRVYFVNKSFENFHNQKAAVLCVFDGHGGAECADYLYQNFIYHLENYQSLVFNIHEPIFSRRDLLEYAFIKVDEQYREKVIDQYRTNLSVKKGVPSPRTTSGIMACAGSTGCTVFITASEEEANTYYVTCANVGDSRAFMIHLSKIIPLSSDHKPTYEQEKRRIEMFGSRVENNRVCGLAVSRTFGDYYAKNNPDPTSTNGAINVGLTQPIQNTNLRKQAVVALPEVVKHKIHLEKPKKVVEKRKDDKDGKDVMFSSVTPSLPTLIVIASDGLFDVMNNSDVADYIYKQYYHHRVKDFNIIAKNLVNHSIFNRNSGDNVSVIIASLHYVQPDQ